MKKKIVFVHNKMVYGGAEQVLVRLLNSFDYTRYQVTLVLMGGQGPLDSALPKEVQVRYAGMESWKYYLKNRRWIELFTKPLLRRKIRNAKTKELRDFWKAKASNPYRRHADCVLCWHPNLRNMQEAVLIKAAKKAVWIHGEFGPNADLEKTFRFLQFFDPIVCVSEGTKEYLADLFPDLASKMETIYNIVDVYEIKAAAEAPLTVPMKHPCIVTVGRLSPEKGMQMIPEILSNLSKQGTPVYWYLIGDGPSMPEIDALRTRYNMEDHLIFLGQQSNPFPFMENCDVYVQPSYTEGYCTTTNEARILGKPIVATDVSGMREQFVNGKTALLVEPTPEGLTRGIARLLHSPELRNAFTEQLQKVHIDNDAQMKRLYEIIDHS